MAPVPTRTILPCLAAFLLLMKSASGFLLPAPKTLGLHHQGVQMTDTFVEAVQQQQQLNGDASSKSNMRLQSNREILEELYPNFPRTWVPLGSTLELDPDRPNRVEFLGQSYVTYFSNATDQWVVMDNTCPHRLAPLSEGRVDGGSRLQCSYHGWTYDPDGSCTRIPQVTPKVAEIAQQNPRACVPSYTTNADAQTGILWIWPWQMDALEIVGDDWRHPEGMMKHLVGLDATNSNASVVTTYTRDQPYSYDTLVENLIDPSHIPFAHHGMQGSRSDAIPINMTRAVDKGEAGFSFDWQDRTMGKMREGTGEFRAPFLVNYDAHFEGEEAKPFRLAVLCVPTKPGWSRVMVFSVQQPQEESTQAANKGKKKKKGSLMATLFKIIPTWASHLLSNKFFDSDLAFLHYQEQLRRINPKQRGDARYFMPAECDRSIVALHSWMDQYAPSYIRRQSTQLPAAIYDRSVLFDHWSQHTQHCKICLKALEGIQKWKRRSQWALAASIVVGFRHWPARILAVACLGAMKLMGKIEGAFYKGEFKHYENQ